MNHTHKHRSYALLSAPVFLLQPCKGREGERGSCSVHKTLNYKNHKSSPDGIEETHSNMQSGTENNFMNVKLTIRELMK